MMPKKEKSRERTEYTVNKRVWEGKRKEGVEATSEAVLVEFADLAKQVTYVCHQ